MNHWLLDGLLSEEYDVDRKRLVGNFPQAFTHLALVGSAIKLDAATAPEGAQVRTRRGIDRALAIG
jgi:GH15 family glucan-1,4-alpha-glucosidase